MMLSGIFTAVILSMAVDASAACYCRCVENVERAICDSPQESLAQCGRAQCPVAPATIKPAPTHRAAVPGTYHCDHMREYSPILRRYEWTELCVSSSRSSTALVRPAAVQVGKLLRPRASSSSHSSSSRAACGTDSDCPSGETCTRRSMSEEWRCLRR